MADKRDSYDDIAALLDIPSSAGSERSSTSSDAEDAVLERHRAYAENLRLQCEDTGYDPVLLEIQDARRRKLQAEQEIRLLIAYAREFSWPRPYKLVDLAEAAGLSISGVRIAYSEGELTQVADAIGRKAQTGPGQNSGESV